MERKNISLPFFLRERGKQKLIAEKLDIDLLFERVYTTLSDGKLVNNT